MWLNYQNWKTSWICKMCFNITCPLITTAQWHTFVCLQKYVLTKKGPFGCGCPQCWRFPVLLWVEPLLWFACDTFCELYLCKQYFIRHTFYPLPPFSGLVEVGTACFGCWKIFAEVVCEWSVSICLFLYVSPFPLMLISLYLSINAHQLMANGLCPSLTINACWSLC